MSRQYSTGGKPILYDCNVPKAEVKVFSREGSASAKDFYFKAIEIDLNCARANVGIAYCYLSDWGYLSDASLDTMERAIHFARIAASQNENYSRAHWVLAYVLTFWRTHFSRLCW